MPSRLVIAVLVLLPAASSSAAELTATDVEAFLDGVMPLQLAREDIAGAAIAIVKDGQLLLAKGYGYSDIEHRARVSPDATLFRPGSISKLFTWTAIMQLVEQGRLDLDRDVNDYLDFAIPATYPKPITLRNILTHTPGFEETFKELAVSDETRLRPLGEYLKRHLPGRIFPPGTTPAYSNYAAALAGYIVERVSGQPFDDYVEAHILTPLGMAHSTFRQPLPDSLRPLMSQGYELASDPPKPFELIGAAPAGSASVSAVDMTRFMIAHLQDGEFQAIRILRTETARLMHSRQLENVPEMNAMALGFYEETRNGHRIIGHGGDTLRFHSDLHLILDAGVGFFISYNSAGKREIRGREAVWQAFLDRYYPYPVPDAPIVAKAAEDARAVLGHYISSRRPETSLFAVVNVLDEWQVSSNEDGSISVDKLRDLNGQPKHFREIAPFMFREVTGQARIAFKRDDSGRLVLAIDFPPFVFQRARWYESAALNLPWIALSVLTLLLTVLLWPVAALVRRHYRQSLALDPRERRLRLWVRVVCLVNLAFFGAFTGFLLLGSSHVGLLTSRSDPWLRLIQVVGWVGALGTGVALYNGFRSWAKPKRSLWSRIGDTLIAIACSGAVAFAFQWNMLAGSLAY
jgi:CubicO group peptidase (beta-lactamase class C family)